jgi:hypothetical protein
MYYCGIKPRAMQTHQEQPQQKTEMIIIHPPKSASPAQDSALVAQLSGKPSPSTVRELVDF